MKTQTELLQGSSIPTDELQGIAFSAAEQDFLAVAEGFASNEWLKVSSFLGITASSDALPENYDIALQRAGRWSLDYPSSGSFEQ